MSGPDRWHRVLQRQLRKAGLDAAELSAAESQWRRLLDHVSASYVEADQERYLVDRAFDISGRELEAANEELRRASASALALERNRLRTIVDSVSTGLVVLDESGAVSSLNPAAASLTGVSAAEGVGMPLERLLQPAADDPEATEAFAGLLTAVRRGFAWPSCDLTVLAGGDRRLPCTLAFAPLAGTSVPAGGVLSVTDRTERARAAAELAWRASHDDLTGLLNRSALMDHLERSLAAPPADGRLAVLFIDLDRFKLVNDTLGHAVGDRLLTEVVTRLRATTREEDTVARLGGDEFVVVAPDLQGPGEAVALAERLVAALSAPFLITPDPCFVGASVGVAVADAPSSAESLLRDADLALYRAKDSGRGRAVLFNASMHSEVAERVRMERHLRHALDVNDLAVQFQPVFRAADGALTGFETLVRWHGPDGRVDPEVFVGLAEETGLVGMLGEWVLRSAVEFIDHLLDIDRPLTVAVNLSAIQLADEALAARVMHACGGDRRRAERLLLEITETALLLDAATARERLDELRATGVRMALDDFGTGYSSLSALRHFRLEALKIDRSFVVDVVRSERDRAIVSAVVALGHALGMTVVAEGIETVEQRDLLRALGCDRLQGFLLGRPLDENAALELAGSAPFAVRR